jgi:tetratricopeptide (TPR) repeat protein
LADAYALLRGPEAGGDMPPGQTLPKAKAAARKAVEIDESLAEPHVSLAHVTYFYAYSLAGKRREADQTLDELLQLSKGQHVSPGQMAIIYIARGEKDKAFQYLEEANRIFDLNVVRLKVERRFDPLRSDPRFADLVRRIGIP